uniref:Uncharacterized protein n=1 Tax=Enterovibrio norvegicus TaxID=188144 RepID=A0A0H3ZXD7_9GAMM|nr:hypothetical protein [Enterovibrio norvegicus]
MLCTIRIDTNHLKNEYLNDTELKYLDSILKSEQDLDSDFYTSDHGDNLECLLNFLTHNKKDIKEIIHGNNVGETLINLYTSPTISGSYDCFRFNLSTFPQTYIPRNQVITLYRIGRTGECVGNLGCSWATSIEGLNTYCNSSSLSRTTLDSRPIFVIKIDDSQVLFEGENTECELVLKPDFQYHTLSSLDADSRGGIGR